MEPTPIKTVDEEGNTFRRVLYRGHVLSESFPRDPEVRLDAIDAFKCGADDIVIGSYPKSGLHWLNNIVQIMTTGDMSYKGSPRMLEYEDLEVLEKMKSPRVYCFHLVFDLLPKEAKQGACKVIHIMRNPKDVIVSWYEFMKGFKDIYYTGNFNGAVKLFLEQQLYFGSWFGYERNWYDAHSQYPDSNVLRLKYEDLKTNLFKCLETLNTYLELGRSEEFLKEIERNVEFEHLKKEHRIKADSVGADFSEILKNTQNKLPLYRKGIIGDWKNYLTVAQNETFDKVYAEQMAGYDMNLQFE